MEEVNMYEKVLVDFNAYISMTDNEVGQKKKKGAN